MESPIVFLAEDLRYERAVHGEMMTKVSSCHDYQQYSTKHLFLEVWNNILCTVSMKLVPLLDGNGYSRPEIIDLLVANNISYVWLT